MRLRLALACCLMLAACSDGDSGPPNTVPVQPWGFFRHDASNSGAGNTLGQNRGRVTLLAGGLGELTHSTPTVDSNSNVFLGTADGVISLDRNGEIRWVASVCALENGATVPIGPVSSSPTVQAGGNIIFGADGDGSAPGGVFYLKEQRNMVECQWIFPRSGAPAPGGVRSSPQVQIDPLDRSLLGVFIGADSGALLAINGIGTLRWTYPPGPASGGPITSTPAVSNTGATYITTPQGLLVGVDAAGRPLQGGGWPAIPIGTAPEAPFLPSPVVSASVYAIGAGGTLLAVNPSGSIKWQYAPLAPVRGSPAVITQSVDAGSETVFDSVVYIVDEAGTLYGVRDATGQIASIQRCSNDVDRSCRTDSCGPGEGTCVQNRCSISDVTCTPDSCLSGNHGMCEILEPSGILPITGGAAVDTSPVISADLFAAVGTVDGRVCARALDDTVPGDDDDPSNPWLAGCLELGDGLPVLSSPAIGAHNRLYVTTATGLYVIE